MSNRIYIVIMISYYWVVWLYMMGYVMRFIIDICLSDRVLCTGVFNPVIGLRPFKGTTGRHIISA